MNSMTGYGYQELVAEGIFLSVEIKSYNSRYLDLTVNLPASLSRLEGFLREQVSAAVVRGKVDVYVRLREEEPATKVLVNREAVRSYAAAMEEIARIMGVPHGGGQEQLLPLIVQQEGVLVAHREMDLEAYRGRLEPVFKAAMEQFLADRHREGQNLLADLQEKLALLEDAAAFFAQWQPQMESAFKENLQRRFQEFLGEGYDQQRVLTEVAALLVKYTINEEIVRLKSHLAALKKELAENPTPGRKIDFICQEINREINTIGSKNQFTEVGAMVITAKDALENIREQARNVE